MKEKKMQSITINISNEKLVEKVLWFLDLLKNEGLEIVSKEDMDELKLLKATRNEASIPFEEYMKNAS
jgi:hypothetical protein